VHRPIAAEGRLGHAVICGPAHLAESAVGSVRAHVEESAIDEHVKQLLALLAFESPEPAALIGCQAQPRHLDELALDASEKILEQP
jgi:hypothetical protein